MLEDTFQLPSISANDALAHARDARSNSPENDSANQTATLIDLRKPLAIVQSGKRIAGSVTRDPYAFDHSDPLMHSDSPLITFCVHGHEVSQFACALLMLHGRDVHYVTGGFEALVAAGAELEDISE